MSKKVIKIVGKIKYDTKVDKNIGTLAKEVLKQKVFNEIDGESLIIKELEIIKKHIVSGKEKEALVKFIDLRINRLKKARSLRNILEDDKEVFKVSDTIYGVRELAKHKRVK